MLRAPARRTIETMPRQLSDTLVRSIALLLALGGYYVLLPHLFEDDSGAAIGTGLIAFGAIVVVSVVWGSSTGSAARSVTSPSSGLPCL